MRGSGAIVLAILAIFVFKGAKGAASAPAPQRRPGKNGPAQTPQSPARGS
jgi:hypothetical protein